MPGVAGRRSPPMGSGWPVLIPTHGEGQYFRLLSCRATTLHRPRLQRPSLLPAPDTYEGSLLFLHADGLDRSRGPRRTLVADPLVALCPQLQERSRFLVQTLALATVKHRLPQNPVNR